MNETSPSPACGSRCATQTADAPPAWQLGRLRRWVQLLMLLVTVYGGLLVGHYTAEKLSNSLPALSCAFDQQNGAYCVLIPLQHQLHHRVGEVVARSGEFALNYLIPLGFTLLAFYGFFFFLNKAFCGWVCPLGTVQELLYSAGRRLGLTMHRVGGRALTPLRGVKWVMLLALVLVLPLLAGLGFVPHAAGDAYCQICPSRMVTTLLTADIEQVAVGQGDWLGFAFGALRNLLFGFVLVAAVTVRQPFCRICPMLALHALLRRFSPMRLTKLPNERCGKCTLCTQACPMDIPEIASQHGAAAFHEDCTLCGRCAEFCPDDAVIHLKFGPLTLFRSRTAYFRRRSREERPDGQRRQPAAPHG